MLKLSDFDYFLPKELIAQYPLKERDSARLLVLNRENCAIEHRVFKDITDYINKDDLLVLNDTKVLPCRLEGKRPTGGKVSVLLVNRKEGLTFNALIKPSRVKTGEKIIFNGNNFCGLVSAKNEISFSDCPIDSVYKLGRMPLPPYIKREPEDLDDIYYQTVYANDEGALASPTAGLHFTKELLQKIELQGVDIAYITLHVGRATFTPVKADDITEHKMEPERFKISDNATKKLEKAKRVIAVGTTSLRALEAYSSGIKEGATDLFVYPGYKFNIVDCLITNFHLPRTTLFMLA
ncbi:MAG: tRNA preQ1(34) S-adenosylmethionine ribosyltransferase-isomerase QueA, partial [Omnitrophica WOR_2 bacterium RBG_13_44_8b]